MWPVIMQVALCEVTVRLLVITPLRRAGERQWLYILGSR